MELQSKKKTSLIIQLFSIFLPIIALVFVIDKIWSVRYQILNNLDIKQTFFIVLGGSMLYAIDNLFIIFAWRQLINWFSESKTNFRIALKVYGLTQITKYIPGNVFHLPSRHLMGRQVGLKHTPLLGAAVFEIIGLLVASGLISSLGFLIRKNQVVQSEMIFAFLFLIMLSPLVLELVFSRVPILKKINLPQKSIIEMYRFLARNWFVYLFFFLVAAVTLWIIIFGVSASWSVIPLGIIFSAYAISWLAGTIIPGAPAGAGVREAVLILMLSGFVGEADSILIALVLRTVTVLGDAYIYLIAQAIR
jgi:glycosyltransferase 2 family protein